MKISIFIFFILISINSCKQHNNIADEKNYILIGTDSFHHVIASKILVNKYDISMKLVMLYSTDTILISKGFYKGKLHNGPSENFYMDGKLLSSEFYENGIKDGLQENYYPNGKLKKKEKYESGKLVLSENFDSSGNKIK